MQCPRHLIIGSVFELVRVRVRVPGSQSCSFRSARDGPRTGTARLRIHAAVACLTTVSCRLDKGAAIARSAEARRDALIEGLA